MSAETQLWQSELLAPPHVPHVAWHGWQTEPLSAYLPTGRHEARQAPGASKKGYAAAHEVHSVSSGPEHVAHASAHATHVSRCVALPPEQVEPSSMAQAASHPSRLTWPPSSHSSPPTRRPSPQTVSHVSFADRLRHASTAHASTVSPSSVVGAGRAAGIARPPTPLGALALAASVGQ